MTIHGPGDPITWGPFDGHPNDPRNEDPCEGCPSGKMCATCSENPDNEPDGDSYEERKIGLEIER